MTIVWVPALRGSASALHRGTPGALRFLAQRIDRQFFLVVIPSLKIFAELSFRSHCAVQKIIVNH
jgi:hypothetical protein